MMDFWVMLSGIMLCDPDISPTVTKTVTRQGGVQGREESEGIR